MTKKLSSTRDMTEGGILSHIISFSIPLILGTLFQTLYNTVDAVIVGQFLGKEALAAVGGGTSTLTSLIIGFFTGVSGGATVIVSQFYGAKDREKLSLSLQTASFISIISGIVITIIGLFFSSPLLSLINTPEDIFPLAKDYLFVYFLGSIPLIIYNMGSGILRAVGDSKRPLYFLIISSLVNIALDILFIGPMKMGVKGAAYATVISEILSAILTSFILLKGEDEVKIKWNKVLSPSPFILKKMLQLGLPSGIQSIMYSVSNMIIQTRVNSFGTDTASAWAAYSKLDVILWMVINSFGLSITTFVGQNYGSGKVDRAKSGVKKCLLLSSLTAIVLSILYLVFGKYGFYLFVNDESVIEIGLRILRTIAPVYILYIPIEILSGAIRGAGKSLVPTLFAVLGICGIRIIWLTIPWCNMTIERVMLSYTVSWGIVSILFFLYYHFSDVYSERKRKLN